MMLTDLRPLLADARKNHYAIPAFDVSNDQMVRAVAECCEAERSPAVFMLLKPDLSGLAKGMLIASIESAARQLTVPVCIHLDHATALEDIQEGIEAGMTSVMFDGSMLPFAENAEKTHRVVEYAHARGVSVEAELGHVGNAIDGLNETGEMRDEGGASLTNPRDVIRFVDETNVDCLAVSIGTAHGVYRKTPTLRLDILEAIERVCPCPLVLHGGSGTGDEALKKAIERGITKINIFSEVLAAMNVALKEKLCSVENMAVWPSIVWKRAGEEMYAVVRHKIHTFGSNGRG